MNADTLPIVGTRSSAGAAASGYATAPVRRQPRGRTLVRLGLAACIAGLIMGAAPSAVADEVTFSSPGLPSSRMDDQGRLLEDWGAVTVKVSAADASAGRPEVKAVKLDGVVPAAQSTWQAGSIGVTVTAFRAPSWPSGLDVLTVALRNSANQETAGRVVVELPESVRIGSRTAALKERTVLAMPPDAQVSREPRDWGWCDDAVAMPGWGRPAVSCDPAFKNIRAGLGGAPILYRFKVQPKAAAAVVLGFCESFWADAGQRPLVCQVEGAAPQEIDPLAEWGQHKPGALQFAARDQNGDGQIEIAVVTRPGAPDENPMLSAIWIFPPKAKIDLDQVIAGKMNSSATHYVDVGGPNDQSLFAGGKLDYAITLAPGTTRELTFLVACPGASVPAPDRTAWNPAKLRRTAADVWREWAEK